MTISLLSASVLSNILYIVLAIFILLLLVTIHELGHYLAARKLGIKVKEFAVGFGKVLWSKTNSRGEKISLRLFPLGGFCAFVGEDEESDPNNPDAFNNQKPWKRLIVQFAGAGFNLLTAVLFSFIFLWSYGYDIMKVAEVPADSQNYSIMQVGDVVYAVNGTDVYFAANNSMSQLLARAAANDPEAPVRLTIKRDGVVLANDIEVYFAEKIVEGQDEPAYALNIAFNTYRQPFFEALGNTLKFVFGWIWVVMKSFWMLITFQLSIKDISGPVGMIGMMAEVSSRAFANIVLLLPLLSINLAVFNLIPFPALDGARMVFTGIEIVRKKPVNRTVEAYIHFFGLVFLFFFVFAVDIIKMLT